ncbi:CoA-substrate-specific enzyme activase [mine drainage metagenome]|uniref:CoA-substrate-specific enzyme activase n=1 Tax=mine drainage metagenome TaxID=410659 RepID=T1CPR9_9ZZZZ
MITAGLDLGASTIKGALLEDGRRTLATASAPSRGIPVRAARRVLEDLGETANIAPDDVEYLCTTGFGRYTIPERHLQVSDFTSSARGAIFLFPKTRMVVDVGAQASRTMSIAETGKVLKFKMNEKCAAGAGRFVERCAKYLQIPLEEMGPKGLTSVHPKLISSVCAVLAETEIINNVAEGIALPDILMGVFLSLAQRAYSLMRYVGIRPEVTLVGGSSGTWGW